MDTSVEAKVVARQQEHDPRDTSSDHFDDGGRGLCLELSTAMYRNKRRPPSSVNLIPAGTWPFQLLGDIYDLQRLSGIHSTSPSGAFPYRRYRYALQTFLCFGGVLNLRPCI
jgi:hypothetical protein